MFTEHSINSCLCGTCEDTHKHDRIKGCQILSSVRRSPTGAGRQEGGDLRTTQYADRNTSGLFDLEDLRRRLLVNALSPTQKRIRKISKFPSGGRIGGVIETGTAGIPMLKEIPQAWASYLEGMDSAAPWSWYGHFTFREDTHPEQAVKTWDLWTHQINRKIFGVNYYKHKSKGITWARGTELQKRGVIHFHAILGRIPADMDRFKYMKTWEELAGFSRIHPYQVKKGAEFYMSKSSYAWKRGEIDICNPLQYADLS